MNARQRRVVIGMALTGVLLILLLAASWRLLSPVAAEVAATGIVPAQVTYPAPDLELGDLDGSPGSLQNLRGQVVLVNLWATWCPPCKQEMPALQTFYARHKGDGFTVVAVNDGEAGREVRGFVDAYGLTFPVWLDPDSLAADRAFRTVNLPSSYVIDRGGMVRLRWMGGIVLPTLEEYVTPIILE